MDDDGGDGGAGSGRIGVNKCPVLAAESARGGIMPDPTACRRRVSSGLDLTLLSALIAPIPRTCHGVLEVAEPSSAWALDPAAEQCLYTARVVFGESFERPPHVVAGLSALELGHGPSARLEVRIVPGTVSRSGFTICFATKAGARVKSAAAFWLAMSA